MNVGIIVYSQTGNTLSVAQKLEGALKANGHAAGIARVEAGSTPDVSPYDLVIFAAPVQAFALAPAMKLYLSQISSLAGKKVCCFVTQQLKKAWLGGNHAVRQIQAACKGKRGGHNGRRRGQLVGRYARASD
jgi:flavodoxin